MVRTIIFICLLGLLATSKGKCQHNLGFALPAGQKKVNIPIEIHNNLIVVPVIMNGQLPLRFILDTGVRTAILTDKSFSDILRLPYSRRYSISGPGGEKIVEAYITNNISFYIPPGVYGDGHAMLVLEKDYLELRNFIGAEVHGILGYELFSRFVIKIDYSAKLLIVIAPDKFKPRRRYLSLPIKIEDTKPYLITSLDMNDSTKLELKLLVDSGASHSLILDPGSDSTIHIPTKHIESAIGRAIGGVITGKIGRIKTLHLGHYELNKVVANFPDPNSYLDTLKSTAVFRNGTLGGEVLSRFTVIFDYSREKLYLKKNLMYRKKFEYNLSGISVKAKGARLKKFEVEEVRKNSVAQRADIRPGDVILGINGNPTSAMQLNNINQILHNKPGKRIILDIERGGQKIKKTFFLNEEI